MRSICNKILSGLALAAGVLFISACAKESVGVGTPAPEVGRGGDGFISLSMLPEEIGLTTKSTVWGTNEENHVAQVRMVLYGKDDDIVKYAFDFKIRSRYEGGEIVGYEQFDVAEGGLNHLYPPSANYPIPTGSPIPYDRKESFITWARKVKVDDYKILLIVNPPEVVDGEATDEDVISAKDTYDMRAFTSVGRDNRFNRNYYVEIKAENLRQKKNAGVAEDNYFLMTNYAFLVDAPRALLQNTEQEAHDKPIEVHVSRAVAKVDVVSNEAGIEVLPVGASISNFKWDLDITNKWTYWKREPIELITDDGAKGEKETSNIPPASFSERKRVYAYDPNMYDCSAAANASVGYRQEQFNTYEGTEIVTPTLTTELGGYTYCLENTMDGNDQGKLDITTRALISCVYSPPGFDASQGNSYFVYNEKALHPTAIAEIKAAANEDELPEFLKGIKKAIQRAESSFGDISDPATNSFDLPAVVDEHENFKYYKNGICYYSVPIQHYPGNSLGNMGYGYYGVVRNVYYSVIVDKILGPGSPTIIFPKLSNIVARVKILNWQNRDQGVDL